MIPYIQEAIFYKVMIVMLLIKISGTDIRARRILDRDVLCLAAFAGLQGICCPECFAVIGLASRLLGSLTVSGFMFLVTLIAPGAFGGGDIKLMAAAGVLLGIRGSIRSFAAGIMLAGMYIGVRLLAGRCKPGDRISLGPFLCIGIGAVYLAGM